MSDCESKKSAPRKNAKEKAMTASLTSFLSPRSVAIRTGQLARIQRRPWLVPTFLMGGPRVRGRVAQIRLVFGPKRVAAVRYGGRILLTASNGTQVTITPTDEEEFVRHLRAFWSPDVPLTDRRIT